MNIDIIEQTVNKLRGLSAILVLLVGDGDSPLSDAILGTQYYLDQIIEEIQAAI